MEESEFDKLVQYTLRAELLNGRVFIYGIDSETKQYLVNKLRANSEENEEAQDLQFLCFETLMNRMVVVNIKEMVRLTFCFDYTVHLQNLNAYYDNFGLLEKDTLIEQKETRDGEVRLHVLEEAYLPQAIIYHKGKGPEDLYENNPLTYSQLDEGCLVGLEMELDGEWSLRQFINLIDNDGEETFIPFEQIVVMEFNRNLVYMEDYEDNEELKGDEEDE